MISISQISETIIDRLDDIMKQKSWNKTQLANDIGIPTKTFMSWMARTRIPKIDYLWQIADYLGVSIDYLVGREN